MVKIALISDVKTHVCSRTLTICVTLLAVWQQRFDRHT